MKEHPNYYSILTAKVRYDTNLSWFEKVLMAEISALSNKTGQCWASNKWFGEVFNQSIRTISRAISKLEEQKYIKVSFEYSESNMTKRIIQMTEAIDKSVHNPNDKNVMGGIDKNVYHNNTSKNNTSINIWVRDKLDFDKFWSKLEGRKKNKHDAFRAYSKIKTKLSAEELSEKFNFLIRSREEKFVPYPQKWLKNEGWLEEQEEKINTTSFVSQEKIYRDKDGYIISEEEYKQI